MRKIINCLICLVTFNLIQGCEADSVPTQPYKIENQSCDKPYKCSYDLRIENKLTEEEITAIANKIKATSPKVERIFIVYYLPCMEVGSGGWATSHFNPDLDVTLPFAGMPDPVCE